MVCQRHVHEGCDGEPELILVEMGMVALDDTGLLECRTPSRALRGRQPDTISQLEIRKPALGLKGVKQLHITSIHARFVPHNLI